MKRVLKCEIRQIGALFVPATHNDEQPGKYVAILLPRFEVDHGDGNKTSFARTSLGQIYTKNEISKKKEPAREADRIKFNHCLTNDIGSWEGSAEISSPESDMKLTQAGTWRVRKYRSSPLAAKLHDLLTSGGFLRYFFPSLYFATFTPIVPSNQVISLGLEYDWKGSLEDYINSIVLGPVLLQNFTQHAVFEIRPIDSLVITGELPPQEEAA